MSQTIVDNTRKEETNSYNLGVNAPATISGQGQQFIIYTAVTVSKLTIKLRRYVYGEVGPVGILTARLYGSHTGNFKNGYDYADGLIAESNSRNIVFLASTFQNVEFNFSDVELPAGIYYICIYATDYVTNDGYVELSVTNSAISSFGYPIWWSNDLGRWAGWDE
jgi:hypothetical protein